MPRLPLADDTPLEFEAVQVEGWRRMSPDDKAALIIGTTQAAFDMALAGLAARHPGASPDELWLRRAILLHGPELAARAYPDILRLGLLTG